MAVNLHATHYRFGVNELAESTHGWHAAEDANPAQGAIAEDTTFLLRFTVQETGGTAAGNTDQQFQCALNGGTFQDITTASTIVKAVTTSVFANGADLTKRLSGTGTFESSGDGGTHDGLSGGPQNDIAASGNSETECALQIVGADVAPGDVITFRLTSPDFTITNDVVPTITMAAGPEEHSGTLSGTGGGVLTAAGRKGASSPLVGTGAGLFTAPADSQRNAIIVGTGAGVLTVVQTTDRPSAVTATGGGIATFTYTTDEGGAEGVLVATGGGVATLAAATDRPGLVTATGGGIGTFDTTTDRPSVLTGTGSGAATLAASSGHNATLTATAGGVLTTVAETARAGVLVGTGGGVATFNGGSVESHSGVLTATGGGSAAFAVTTTRRSVIGATGSGALTLSVESARLAAALWSGGGVLTAITSTDRYGTLVATGGGDAAFNSGTTPTGLPDIVVASIVPLYVRIGAIVGEGSGGTATNAAAGGSITPIPTVVAEIHE